MDILTRSKYVVGQFLHQSPDGITPMKRQKLLYYIKVWTLIAEKAVLNANFEHWNDGRGYPEVYEFYKQYGGSAIDPC